MISSMLSMEKMIWTHFEAFSNETKCSNKFVISSMVRQWWQYYNYIHLFWKKNSKTSIVTFKTRQSNFQMQLTNWKTT